MANYFIIGGDGKEYGPVTDADIRQWLAEGRLNAQSQTKAESDAEFRPLAAFPEFADALGLGTPERIAALTGAAAGMPPLERDYELDLGGCIARGYQLLKDHFSVVFIGVLIYLLIEGFIGGLANIPIVGPIFSIVNVVISGPLVGGVFYLLLRALRGEPVEAGAVFEGFRRQFGQLFLGTFVQGLIIGACLVPAAIVAGIKMLPMIHQLKQGGHLTPEQMSAILKPVFISCLPVLVICLIPVIYLGTCWKFTLPLIIDRGLDFWSAMKASFKMVNKHWWQVFSLMILIGLVNLAGFLACCVGLLFTMPIGLGALMYAYETIFGDQKN